MKELETKYDKIRSIKEKLNEIKRIMSNCTIMNNHFIWCIPCRLDCIFQMYVKLIKPKLCYVIIT